MIKNEGLAHEAYSVSTAEEWGEAKTMEHASGIWGRDAMFKYLQKDILHKGDNVVDIGCGGGYPTVKVAEVVGPNGKVIGVDYSRSQLGLDVGQEPLSEKYRDVKNVSFIQGYVEQIPLGDATIDKAVSFMVIHNLDTQGVNSVFKETERVLKLGGIAVFLTMHPEILDSEDWDLDFWRYSAGDIEKYKKAKVKEGVVVRGIAKDVSGGEKMVFMYNHTRKNIEDAIECAGLNFIRQDDIWVDEKTAIEKFGKEAVKKVPTKPAFWIITVTK